MTDEIWTAVDGYLVGHLVGDDPILEDALERSRAAELPAIQVSPLQGKLLMLLARLQGARRILEIGTLGGYSTIWLARALPPEGRLITLELEPRHAEVARANLEHAGLTEQVEVRVGRALDSLATIAEEGLAPFDLIFIDADKSSNPEYLEWALKLSRPGSLIIVDNVVRSGAIIDARSEDPAIQATRRLHERLGEDPRLEATVIQTVGMKGYDGFALARVLSI
ncbi:MAG TPA: O-methyltransferase [Longimicrobiaceae bacterium]